MYIRQKGGFMVAFADRDKQLAVECVYCGAEYVLWVNEKDFLDWTSGIGYIQDKLPYLSANERELLISGTCDNCWNKMFGADDNEEDDDV
jgi:hypothetical protein